MKTCMILLAGLMVSVVLGACGGGGASKDFKVGGTVSGLQGTVTLQNNGADDLSISQDGNFSFGTRLQAATAYAVTIKTQPTNQVCTVANGTGTIAKVDVTSVTVTCSVTNFKVGGTVTGLHGTVVLQNNGSDDLNVSQDGSFSFGTRLQDATAYAVTIKTQPTNRVCTVANGTGTIAKADVTNVTVTCSVNSFKVGGTVTGLQGTLVLKNNGADDLSVSSAGTFTFTTGVADGSPYEVTVGAQPAAQTCFVAKGTGTIQGANVTDVAVTCFDSGTLDMSFGGKGYVVQDESSDSVTGLVIDQNGRIILAGDGGDPNLDMGMMLRAFKDDGQPATDFGTNGVVLFENPGGTSCEDKAEAVALDAGGKIVAAGYSSCAGVISLALWRYNPDGTPDATFGTNGFATFSSTGYRVFGYGLVLDGSGRILVAGVREDSNFVGDMAVWRFKPDGTLDTGGFGTGGATYINNVAGGNRDDRALGIALDAAGKIVITGYSDNASSGTVSYDMAMVRLKTDGSLDDTFGTGGLVSNNNAAGGNWWDQGWAITIDHQGKILVTGMSIGLVSGNQVSFMALWRYNPDGTLDGTFGTGGIVTTHGTTGANDADHGYALAVDHAGRILVAGISVSDALNPAVSDDMALWRFNPDGSPDLSFNHKGSVTHGNEAGGNKNDMATCLALDALGRIVVGGISDSGNGFDAVIWRYFP